MCTMGRLLCAGLKSPFCDVLWRTSLCLRVVVDVRQVSVQDTVSLRPVDGTSGKRTVAPSAGAPSRSKFFVVTSLYLHPVHGEYKNFE